MRETPTAKQCHEYCLERLHSLKEISQSPLSAESITHQQSEKINGFVGAESSPFQTDLIAKGFKKTCGRQMTGEDDDFSKPRRDRGSLKWRGVNLDTRVGYHR